MIDLPHVPRLITLVMQLERSEEVSSGTAELYWSFHRESHDFASLKEWLSDALRITEGDRQRWTTAEMANLMALGFRDPEALINKVWSRVAALEARFRVRAWAHHGSRYPRLVCGGFLNKALSSVISSSLFDLVWRGVIDCTTAFGSD